MTQYNEYRDKAILQMYLNEKKTLDEIAEEIGCSRRLVCNILKNNGIEYKHKAQKK